MYMYIFLIIYVYIQIFIRSFASKASNCYLDLYTYISIFILIKRCSNQRAEIFMNETNMRRFEGVFTNRITTS